VIVLEDWKDIDENLEEWLQSDTCEHGFQGMIDGDIASAPAEQRDEEGENSHLISHIIWRGSVSLVLALTYCLNETGVVTCPKDESRLNPK
jgi:hypothetical protein